MANDLDDLFGEIKLAQSDAKRTSDSANTGQRSLFTYGIEGIHKSDDEKINREGMKKAAVDKQNKEDAARELKAKQKAAEKEAAKKAESYQRSMLSSSGNVTKSGGGGSATGIGKMNRDITKNMKTGGKVSSASKRADGCCIRGKTKI
jgi:membrane protein involved in colicin uptake